ncbi:hypothetical protein GQ44DRAFT_673044 [Phaeosphaeriaceae sp. PMI808]|nr:hypothetical protein GQ44DRAFT_673044 [Phaeosphaeriaceae sp. PMI808]
MNAMKHPRTAPWGLRISNADLIKLKAGREPRNQNDKWRISVTDESENGNMSITINRHMLSKDVYIIHVKQGDGGDGGHIIEALTWEQDQAAFIIPEEQAKQQVVTLSRFLLKCDIEALPEYDRTAVWSYSTPKEEAN